MNNFVTTNKKWTVKVTQKDRPRNSFTAVYTDEQEYNKWMALHKADFNCEVDVKVEMTFTVSKGEYPALDEVVDPNITYTLEAYLPVREDWVVIRSGLLSEKAVNELLDQLKIVPPGPRNPATAFRVVRVVRDVIQTIGDLHND